MEERNRQLLRDQSERGSLEQHFLGLLELGFDAVCICRQGKILYADRKMGELFNRPVSELLGSDLFELLAPQAREKFEDFERQASLRAFQTKFMCNLGLPAQMEVFAGPYEYQDQPACVFAFRNISEQLKMEKRLRVSEKRFASTLHQFEAVLEAIPDPLALFNREMKTIWTNQVYDNVCAQLGFEPENGQNFFTMITGNRKNPVLRCLDVGTVIEDVIIAPDKRAWGVKAFPLKTKQQQTHQVLAMAVDITEKMRLREEAIRTSRLASLGEIAAGIAHEINNPNAIILLNAPILSRVLDDALPLLRQRFLEQGDFLLGGLNFELLEHELPLLPKRIEEGSQRISRIVEDLKNFVREEEQDDMSLINLNLVVEAAVRLLANVIPQRTRRFRLVCAENMPQARGSFQKLEQVVINLIQNACQALTEPEQAVEVSTRYDPEREWFEIKVRDEGSGIPPDIIDRLTDPFFSTKRAEGGTGLGLSVSSRILQAHHGYLSIESVFGEGSEFSIHLPRDPGAE